jgi:serine/threonine-protein kinase
LGPESLARIPVGRLIAGKYRLDRLIGKGGMGAVYAGQHELLGQAVAIKLLSDGSREPAAGARFLNEARAAARIPSDHVVRVVDVGVDEGRPYLVMEYLEGEDLARVLYGRGPLPEKEAVDYVLQAVEALAQAHALGIIHRDLKPSNLFLAKRPDGSRLVKVLDFGIAKAFGSAVSTQHAAVTTQGLIGSPAYMAPEYVRSAKSIDTRADIWAIGVILYELLSGSVPFRGDNPGEVLAAILETTPAPLASLRGGLSPGLVAVVMKCLARKPEERYPELADVAEALAPYAPKARASVMNIRTTVHALRLRPADITGPMQARAAPDAETALAPLPGQQTNQSWTDASEVRAPPTPMAKALAVAAGIGIVCGVAAVVALGVARFDPAPSSAAASIGEPLAPPPAVVHDPDPPAPVVIPPDPAPPATAAAPTPAPRRRPAHIWHPQATPPAPPPPKPSPTEPTLARDRR